MGCLHGGQRLEPRGRQSLHAPGRFRPYTRTAIHVPASPVCCEPTKAGGAQAAFLRFHVDHTLLRPIVSWQMRCDLAIETHVPFQMSRAWRASRLATILYKTLRSGETLERPEAERAGAPPLLLVPASAWAGRHLRRKARGSPKIDCAKAHAPTLRAGQLCVSRTRTGPTAYADATHRPCVVRRSGTGRTPRRVRRRNSRSTSE